MSLTPGSRIGSYEITGSLGAGGMGEVYRARDLKLHRDVAIKVLPDLFANDPDRLLRFEREAQSLAALNHPNIAQVFAVIEHPPALAMELVEGDDLSTRIAAGPVPLGEALPIATQIADALEAAHERGIIHRDLKPANIKVRDDGTVKVLDFGLAKALDPTMHVGSANAMHSPTFTSPAMTAGGVILGTAAYMAPEQARGKAVDKRADIWAFGVILFEMLAGRQLFGGETASDMLAAVLREDIDWTQLPADTPLTIRRVLRRCLQKDPRQRLRDIGDARLDIDDAFTGKDSGQTNDPVRSAPGASRAWLSVALVAALAVGVFGTWLGMRGRPQGPAQVPVVRFDVTLPADVIQITNVALSADARFVVYAGTSENQTLLYVHRLDSGASRPLPGTTGARWPFVSPDGKWVGFFRAGKLMKVAVDGGDVLNICNANGGPGALWLSDRRIVFAASWLSALFAVPEDGGTPTAITTLDTAAGEKGHWWPSALPDGRLLFTVFTAGAGLNDNRLAVLDPRTGRHQMLFAGAKGSWVPSGHVLFYRAGRYQVVPFDLAATRVAGEPKHVLEDATDLDPAGDWPNPVTFSSTGAVAYVPGHYVPPARVMWIAADGKMTPTSLPVRPYVDVALAPNEEQLALATLEGGRLSLRIADLGRGTDAPLEADGMNWDPVWHPDGRLSFTSMRKGDFDVFIKDLTRGERETPLVDDAMDSSPSVWTGDGRLIFDGSQPDGSYVLKLMEVGHASAAKPITSQDTISHATISPDQKWLAFSSRSDGHSQLYLQPFPGPGAAVQVSTNGGENPVFRPSGRELFFRRGSQLISAGWEERLGKFFILSERVVANVSWPKITFDQLFGVAKDGRVVAIVSAEDPRPPRVTVVLGWAQGLRSR